MADIDRDGDLDLFAGGRTVPGRYPEPASSMLFINDKDRFLPDDKNNSMLTELGLITGALFSDIDTDGDPDLVLAREWGPVTILENSDATFTDATDRFGLSDYTGWWNGVATGDFNEDGRLDIVATNWGLNTKYHASAEHPLTLYYDDFDKNGTVDIVEGHWDEEMGTVVPERGLSCLSTGIPYVKMRKPTYADFGEADLFSILGHRLNEAELLHGRRRPRGSVSLPELFCVPDRDLPQRRRPGPLAPGGRFGSPYACLGTGVRCDGVRRAAWRRRGRF